MPTETAAPVVEKSVEKPASTPAVAEKQPGSRFPKRPSLAAVVADQGKKPEPEKPAKAEPKSEKAPETPAKTEPTAKEGTKPSGDTQTTPKAKAGSLRETLSQGEAIDELPKVEKTEKPDDDEADYEEGGPRLTEEQKAHITKIVKKRLAREKGNTAAAQTARELAEKKAKELEARIAEFDAKPKITEAQQKEQEAKEEELLRLRRRFSLETDPEVKKFDTRIEAARKTIDTTVEKAEGIPDFIRNMIKDAGGMETFLRSGKAYTVKVEGEEKRLTGSQIFKHISPLMDPLDVGTIQTSIAEQNRIQTEKAGFVEEESKKAKEYYENQAKKTEEANKSSEAAQQQQAAMFANVAERIGKEKFMVDEEVPTTGDEDEIAEIKSRNNLRKVLKKTVEETINFKPTSPEEMEKYYTEVVRDSVKVYYVQHELKQAQAKIKKLEASLDAIKGAARSTPKGTNGAAAPAAAGGTKIPARKPNEGNLAYGLRLLEAGIPEAERLAALSAK